MSTPTPSSNAAARAAAWGLLLAGLALGGCASLSERERNTAVGAAVGGVAGSVLTGGSTAGTLGGAVIGGVIGHEVDGDGKDKRRRDRRDRD